MSFEKGLDNLSLDTDATSMDDPNLPKPPLNSLIQVFLYNNGDFLRLKGVEIDRVLNRDLVHFIQYNGRL